MQTFLTNFLNAGQTGLTLIATAVLPVLFPFFVITSLILNLVPSRSKFAVAGLSYLSGYPNGTRLTKMLYEQKILTRAEAWHLSVLTSTPSPIFVIATVGTLFLNNTMMGVVIFICAVLGAILNALLWRPRITKANSIKLLNHPNTSFLTAFNQALTSSTSAIVNVCGVVLFFNILAQLLHLPTWLAGILEMTTGTAGTLNPLLIEFFVCFGGLSVAMQNQLFASSFELPFGYYLTYKVTHGIIACGLLSLYLLFF